MLFLVFHCCVRARSKHGDTACHRIRTRLFGEVNSVKLTNILLIKTSVNKPLRHRK